MNVYKELTLQLNSVTKIVYRIKSGEITKAYFYWKGNDFALSSKGWEIMDKADFYNELTQFLP